MKILWKLCFLVGCLLLSSCANSVGTEGKAETKLPTVSTAETSSKAETKSEAEKKEAPAESKGEWTEEEAKEAVYEAYQQYVKTKPVFLEVPYNIQQKKDLKVFDIYDFSMALDPRVLELRERRPGRYVQVLFVPSADEVVEASFYANQTTHQVFINFGGFGIHKIPDGEIALYDFSDDFAGGFF